MNKATGQSAMLASSVETLKELPSPWHWPDVSLSSSCCPAAVLERVSVCPDAAVSAQPHYFSLVVLSHPVPRASRWCLRRPFPDADRAARPRDCRGGIPPPRQGSPRPGPAPRAGPPQLTGGRSRSTHVTPRRSRRRRSRCSRRHGAVLARPAPGAGRRHQRPGRAPPLR